MKYKTIRIDIHGFPLWYIKYRKKWYHRWQLLIDPLLRPKRPMSFYSRTGAQAHINIKLKKRND